MFIKWGVTMKLIIDGFKTKEQVEEFWSWYSGAGEQDAGSWFECRKEEGVLDVSFMPMDYSVRPKWNDDTYNVKVEVYE